MQMSLTDLWGHMGWFARGIVIVLLIMSVISLSVAVATGPCDAAELREAGADAVLTDLTEVPRWFSDYCSDN